MTNGVSDQYRRNSTILGDVPIVDWLREKEDQRIARERKQKAYIADKIPDKIKNKPLSGVEMEQFNKGMSLLNIWKRRMNKE